MSRQENGRERIPRLVYSETEVGSRLNFIVDFYEWIGDLPSDHPLKIPALEALDAEIEHDPTLIDSFFTAKDLNTLKNQLESSKQILSEAREELELSFFRHPFRTLRGLARISFRDHPNVSRTLKSVSETIVPLEEQILHERKKSEEMTSIKTVSLLVLSGIKQISDGAKCDQTLEEIKEDIDRRLITISEHLNNRESEENSSLPPFGSPEFYQARGTLMNLAQLTIEYEEGQAGSS